MIRISQRLTFKLTKILETFTQFRIGTVFALFNRARSGLTEHAKKKSAS